jgi:hypothetical protein
MSKPSRKLRKIIGRRQQFIHDLAAAGEAIRKKDAEKEARREPRTSSKGSAGNPA